MLYNYCVSHLKKDVNKILPFRPQLVEGSFQVSKTTFYQNIALPLKIKY